MVAGDLLHDGPALQIPEHAARIDHVPSGHIPTQTRILSFRAWKHCGQPVIKVSVSIR